MVNILSVNIQSLYEFAHHANMIFSCVFSIIIGIVLLWREIGVASLAGLFVMLLFTPFSSYFTTKSKRLQIKKLRFQDNRIKTINELLNGIKVVKFYAWEMSFVKLISALRASEIKILKRIALFEALSNFSWTFSPFLVYLKGLNILRFLFNFIQFLLFYIGFCGLFWHFCFH